MSLKGCSTQADSRAACTVSIQLDCLIFRVNQTWQQRLNELSSMLGGGRTGGGAGGKVELYEGDPTRLIVSTTDRLAVHEFLRATLGRGAEWTERAVSNALQHTIV